MHIDQSARARLRCVYEGVNGHVGDERTIQLCAASDNSGWEVMAEIYELVDKQLRPRPKPVWFCVSLRRRVSDAFVAGYICEAEEEFEAVRRFFDHAAYEDYPDQYPDITTVKVPPRRLPIESYRGRLLTLQEMFHIWPDAWWTRAD